MECINCHLPIEADSSYCRHCGTPQQRQARAETCEIVWQRHARGFTSQQWFEAVAIGPTGRYVAARSEPFKGGTSLVGGGKVIATQSSEALAALDSVIAQLRGQGWEPTTERGEFWFNERFRRRM